MGLLTTRVSSVCQEPFRVGEWLVEPNLNRVSNGSGRIHLEPKAMQVLLCLAEHAGGVVHKEELISQVWAGTFVSDQVLTNAIWQLREAFGKEAGFIKTVPKVGYQLVAQVTPVLPPAMPTISAARPTIPAAGTACRRKWHVPAALVLVAALLVLGTIAVWNWRSRGAGQKPKAQIASLAVLPLANFSGDSEQEYFADGMTDELITNLSRITALKVISRTSVMRYKGTRKSIPEIARELGVQGIVQGSVQRSATRVRITAQLIDGTTEQNLWSETYERDIKNVLSLRNDIARSIAAEVRANLTPAEKSHLTRAHSVVPEAYEAYLKGRYLFGSGAGEEARSAEFFQKAVESDPGYAAAWAALAHADGKAAMTLGLPLPQRMITATLKALELDSTLPEAHLCLGLEKFYWEWDWKEGEDQLRRALELDPSSAEARVDYAQALMMLKRYDEALAELDRVHRFDPLSKIVAMQKARVLRNLERPEAAMAQYQLVLALDPAHSWAHGELSILLEDLGRDEEAIGYQLKYQVLYWGMNPQEIKRLEAAFRSGGMRAYWQTVAELLTAEATRGRVNPRALAVVYIRAGDNDKAIAWLEQMYRDHSPQMPQLRNFVFRHALQSDARYQDLVRRMHFPD